jgi:outer membrane protein, heavy metal efflux system
MAPRRLLPLASCLLMVLTIWLWSWCPSAAAAASDLPADLQALIDEALQANSELRQQAHLKAAAGEAVQPAGALDDPEFAFILKDVPTNTWRLDQDEMTQKMLEVSQKIPFPGKRRLRAEIAGEQAKSAGFAYNDKTNEIRARVVMAYWDLSLAHAAFDITEKNKQFWDQVVQVSETRYGVGLGEQADVLQAQVELGNYLDRLFQWRQRQESIRADLNALRSKPQQTPIQRPQPLKPRPHPLKLEDLLSRAEEHPQLQTLEALVAKQQKAVDLARKEYFPDFSVSLSYGFREDLGPPMNEKIPNMFSSKLMVNLPIWHSSKIKPRIREEEAMKKAAEASQQSAWNRLAAAIKDRHAKLERLSQQIRLYEQGLIPQARQAVEASLASYQVGRLDFAQMYPNHIAAYNAELQLQEYLKDFEENWAELEWLVGGELPRRPGASP